MKQLNAIFFGVGSTVQLLVRALAALPTLPRQLPRIIETGQGHEGVHPGLSVVYNQKFAHDRFQRSVNWIVAINLRASLSSCSSK